MTLVFKLAACAALCGTASQANCQSVPVIGQKPPPGWVNPFRSGVLADVKQAPSPVVNSDGPAIQTDGYRGVVPPRPNAGSDEARCCLEDVPRPGKQ